MTRQRDTKHLRWLCSFAHRDCARLAAHIAATTVTGGANKMPGYVDFNGASFAKPAPFDEDIEQYIGPTRVRVIACYLSEHVLHVNSHYYLLDLQTPALMPDSSRHIRQRRIR